MFDPRSCKCPPNPKLKQAEWCSSFAEEKGCHPEGLWQAWQVSPHKCHGIQHSQEQTWVCLTLSINTGLRMNGLRAVWQKWIWATGEWKVGQDPAMCAHSPESQLHWHQKQHGQQGGREDSPSALVRFHLKCLDLQWHERYGFVGASPVKGHRTNQRVETSLLWGVVKEKSSGCSVSCCCSAQEEKVPGKLFCDLSIYNRGSQGR